MQKHEDIVKQLLEANADPDLPIKVIHTYHHNVVYEMGTDCTRQVAQYVLCTDHGS